MNPSLLKDKLRSIVSDNRSLSGGDCTSDERRRLFDRARELMENPDEDLEKTLREIAKESPAVGQLLALTEDELTGRVEEVSAEEVSAADEDATDFDDTASDHHLLGKEEDGYPAADEAGGSGISCAANAKDHESKIFSVKQKMQRKLEEFEMKLRIAKQADSIVEQVKRSMTETRFDPDFDAWRTRVWDEAIKMQDYDDKPFEDPDGKPRSWVVVFRHIDEAGDEVVQEVGDLFRKDLSTDKNPIVSDYRYDPVVRRNKHPFASGKAFLRRLFFCCGAGGGTRTRSPTLLLFPLVLMCMAVGATVLFLLSRPGGSSAAPGVVLPSGSIVSTGLKTSSGSDGPGPRGKTADVDVTTAPLAVVGKGAGSGGPSNGDSRSLYDILKNNRKQQRQKDDVGDRL
eukprot:g16798.t1